MNSAILVESKIDKALVFTVILKDVETLDTQNKDFIIDESTNIIFNNAKILHVEDVEYKHRSSKGIFWK